MTFEQDWNQAWTFTSSVTRPDGVKFEVTCTVSPDDYGDDFPELSEITQMAVARIVTDLRNNDRIKNRGVVKIMERPRGPRVPTSGLRYMDDVTGELCPRDEARDLLCTNPDPDHRHRAWGGE